MFRYIAGVLKEDNFSPSFDYIRKNFHKPLTVQQLADLEHFNPTYYVEWFKQRFLGHHQLLTFVICVCVRPKNCSPIPAVASKYALDIIPPFTLLFFRYILASVILIGWCRQSRIAILPKRNKLLMFQIGFMGLLFRSCQISFGISSDSTNYYLGNSVGYSILFPPAVYEFSSWDASVMSNSMMILSLLYLGIVSTTIAYYCWNKGSALTSPHQAGLFIFLQSIVGSILGYLLLGEALTLTFAAGAVLILAAVGLSISSNTTPAIIDKKL